MTNSNLRRTLLIGVAAASLGGCGANDIASPGTGGNVTINNNTTTPAPTPTPTPTSTLVSAATGCPTLTAGVTLTDNGVITGPTGSYRRCQLPQYIGRSVTLTRIPGLLYEMGGRVDVGADGGFNAPSTGSPYTSPTTGATNPLTADTNVTLTINPGVVIYSSVGNAFLAVNRGNRISAVGTATAPIVFTSRDNILGLNSDSSSGQWGGVVLLGRAPVTDCNFGVAATTAAPATVQTCERDTEGVVPSGSAVFGGNTPTYNAGQMSYVQLRYSGFILSANTELQALTTEGTGNATVIDHIQSFNSSDDGAEFFGGRVNFRYYISVGAEDDNIDTDVGIKANFQYVIAIQRNGIGEGIIEADSDNAADNNLPRHNVALSNFTFRANSQQNNEGAMLIRGGADYNLSNGIVLDPTYVCLSISRAQTASTTADATIDEVGAPVFNSVVMQCGTAFRGQNGVTDAQVQSIFTAGTNNSSTFTPTPTGLGASIFNYVNGANETAVAAFNATTVPNNVGSGTFFTQTSYIGAVRDATDTWYAGWTCNSATANFGSGNSGLCTSLPTI